MPTVEEQVVWWQRQAGRDLTVARSNRAGGFHDACALMCQQSAEKYLKALIFKRTKAVPPKTHQCEHLATLLSAPSEVVDAARRVESDYMGSRYPDMAQGVPYEMFTDATSEQATRAAEVVERWVIQQLSMTP